MKFCFSPSWSDIIITCVLARSRRDAGKWKKEAYSDAVSVDAVCDACEGRYLAFVFHNNAHNVQLLLPITVEIDVEPWVRAARARIASCCPAFNMDYALSLNISLLSAQL